MNNTPVVLLLLLLLQATVLECDTVTRTAYMNVDTQCNRVCSKFAEIDYLPS
jgi:hypothetical protein